MNMTLARLVSAPQSFPGKQPELKSNLLTLFIRGI